MILYFLANSQWGSAPSKRWGTSPAWNTVRLSSAVFPSGTIALGILGIRYRISLSELTVSSREALYCLICSLRSAVCAFACSASCLLPSFISVPISLESLLLSARALSNLVCIRRRCSSKAIASSTSSNSLKFLFFNPLITRSLFSRM